MLTPVTAVPVEDTVKIVVPATPTVVAAPLATVTLLVPLLIELVAIPVSKLPFPRM